jgi:hypothetical protein
MKILLLLPFFAVFTPHSQPVPRVYPARPDDFVKDNEGSTSNPAVTQAMAEASHWLNLVDQQQYGPAWLDSGPLMKDIINEQEWIGAMDYVRAPFGNNLSRQLNKSRSISALPHGTKGNFMSLEYRSQFSGNHGAIERIALMSDSLGQWRVISYDIRSSQ